MKSKFLGMLLAVLGIMLVSCNKDKETNKVDGVRLDRSELNMVVGDSEKLTATVTPDNADNKNVNWTSSDSEVASVANDGTVTAAKEGTAVITVTTEDGGKTATCNVTVAARVINVENVSLDKTEISIEAGSSEKLTATVTPEDATDKSVSWSSSAEDVAKVDAEGNVTAVKEGSAVITVTTTDGGKTASCNVTVTAKTIHPDAVALDKTELVLDEGATEKLTATVTPEDATDKSVKWSSSSEDIATVDAEGNVTAVKEGTAVITVTTTDGGKTATCNVTVNAAPAVVITGETFYKEGIAFGGEVVKLTASVDVTWSSSDETVATVDADGNVTFLNDKDDAPVTITATAKNGGGAGTMDFTVKVTYFEFLDKRYDSGATIQIPYNKMRNIYMKCMPGSATNTRISCKLYDIEIEDPKVVNAYTDDIMGRMIGVTGKQLGTTKLTVTFKDSGLSLFVNLEVVEQ